VNVIAYVLMGAGLAFLAVSAIGVAHLPTFFSRAHAVAKSETVIVIAGIANPTAVHALARAAAARAEARRSQA
jgi:multisubunit Na+/H+ antiporter MnhG subunit